MSIPGMSNKAAAPAKTAGSKFGGFGSQTFEEPTVGEKIPAVCVERVFDEIPDFKTGKPRMKLILVFELAEKKEDSTPFFRELKMYPGFTKSGKGGCDKHFKTWAGSATPLNEQQQAEWTEAINGQSDFENDAIDPTPPLVGLNCQLMLEYNEAGTFINIEKVFPPTDAQLATPLTPSKTYKGYFERKAEREAKNQQGSGGRQQSRSTGHSNQKDDETDIPF